MKSVPPSKAANRNWVAKHAQTFCKAAVHRNKKKDYVRTPKHRHRDFGVSFWGIRGCVAVIARSAESQLPR